MSVSMLFRSYTTSKGLLKIATWTGSSCEESLLTGAGLISGSQMYWWFTRRSSFV